LSEDLLATFLHTVKLANIAAIIIGVVGALAVAVTPPLSIILA